MKVPLRQQIEHALNDMSEPLLLTERDTPGFRKRLAREAQVVMDAFVRSGVLTHVTVHVVDGPEPLIEVHYREPKRVQAVCVRLSPLG